jgi:NADH-quinone oxidoreductase subunit I
METFDSSFVSKSGDYRVGDAAMIRFLRNTIQGAWSLIQGMIITSKNLITPAVTLQYPDKKETMNERFRGLVDLDPPKCIACYQCVRLCPTGCLYLAHEQVEQKKIPKTFTFNMELCCFCGLCEQACPTRAIYLNKIYEIATTHREPLHIDLLDPEKYHEWSSRTAS